MLLGELSNSKHLDTVQKKLMRNLKSKCKVDANESFLKVILGGGKHVLDGEACVPDLFLKKGCCIGKALHSDDEICEKFFEELGDQKLSDLAVQLLHDAVNELEEDPLTREPLILVLDFEVQVGLFWFLFPYLHLITCVQYFSFMI